MWFRVQHRVVLARQRPSLSAKPLMAVFEALAVENASLFVEPGARKIQ